MSSWIQRSQDQWEFLNTIPPNRLTWLSLLGTVALGLAGFLDMWTTLWVSTTRESESAAREFPIVLNQSLGTADTTTFKFQHWNGPNIQQSIGFLFSFLWFLDAFSRAQDRRKQLLLEEERDKLLKKAQPIWYKSPRWNYYWTVLLQVLLLPVGFYLVVLYLLDGALSHEKDVYSFHVWVRKFFFFPAEESCGGGGTCNDADPDPTLQKSLLFVAGYSLFSLLSESSQRAIHSYVQYITVKLRPKAIQSVLGQALRNPLKFRRLVLYVLRLLRWVKYLAPLIAAANKLKKNVNDFLLKWQQRRVAKIQQLVLSRWRLGEDGAARRIQTAFRAHKAREVTRALQLIQGEAHFMASIKLQRAFRGSLARARERLKAKKEFLREQMEAREEGVPPVDEKVAKQYWLVRQEVVQQVQARKRRKLLLRPNSRFAVIWKCLLIICIATEMTRLLVRPWLEKHKVKREDMEKPMPLSEFVAMSIIPTRVSDRPECILPKPAKSPVTKLVRTIRRIFRKKDKHVSWYCRRPISTFQEAYSDSMSFLFKPGNATSWPECQWTRRWPWQKFHEPELWYCHTEFVKTHEIYRRGVRVFFTGFDYLTRMVAVVDFFIAFFTGTYDTVTGELKPAPFFVRWIFPGLLFQLLMNPEFATVAQWTWEARDIAFDIGPVRIVRWFVAVISPMFSFLWWILLEFIWLPLTHHENQYKTMLTSLL